MTHTPLHHTTYLNSCELVSNASSHRWCEPLLRFLSRRESISGPKPANFKPTSEFNGYGIDCGMIPEVSNWLPVSPKKHPPTHIYLYKCHISYIFIYVICIYIYIHHIRRPLPWPKQGRRLGPPEVWNLQAFPRPPKPAVCLLANASNLSNHPASLSKATLAATCPSQLFLMAFKAAVCPPLQGNNSRCYMSQPKPIRRPFQGNSSRSYMLGRSRLPFARLQTHQTPPQAFPRQQLSQLHARAFTAVCPPSNPSNPSASFSKATTLAATCYTLHPSVFKGVQGCCLPAFKPLKPSRRPFQGNNSRSYMLHAPASCLQRRSRLPFARLQTHQTRPRDFPRQQLSQLHATSSSHLFLRAFKAAVRPPSNPFNLPAGLSKATTLAATCYMLQPSVFNGVQGCCLPAFKPIKPVRRPFQGNNFRSYMLHAPAILFSRRSKLPFARLQTPLTFPQAFPRQQLSQLHATCSSHLFLRAFKAAVRPPSNPSNPSAGPPRQQLSQLHAYMLQPSLWRSRLPFARLQTPQTLPQAFPRQQLSQLHATCSSHLFLKGVQGCRSPAFKPPNPPAGLSKATTLAATCYMLQPSVFKGVQGCRSPAFKPL